MKMFAFSVGWFGLNESTHSENHKDESEIVWTTIIFSRGGFLFSVNEGKHVVSELNLCYTAKDPGDLLEIGIGEGDGAIPGGKM